MEKLTTPLNIGTHCRLSGLYQQEAQQRIALFADMSQSSPVSTGCFAGNQTNVAGDPLATAKPLRRSNDRFERQCSQGTYSRMSHELACHWSLLHLMLQGSGEFQDLGVQLIQQGQQVLSPSTGPGAKLKDSNCLRPSARQSVFFRRTPSF